MSSSSFSINSNKSAGAGKSSSTGAEINDHTSALVKWMLSADGTLYANWLYAGFTMPNEYKKKIVRSIASYCWQKMSSRNQSAAFYNMILGGSWNENTIVPSTAVETHYIYNSNVGTSPGDNVLAYATVYNIYDTTKSKEVLKTQLKNIFDYGLVYKLTSPGSGTDYTLASFYTSRAENTYKPFIQVIIEDEDNTLQFTSVSPTRGYVPKYASNIFSWQVETAGISYADVYATNYKLQWRNVGSANYTEINCGTSTSYTIPANTFAQNDIEWRVVATDNYSATVASSWNQLSTEEAISTAVAIEPKNDMIDGSKSFLLRWNHIISTGTAQTRADIQVSTDGTTYTNFATVNSSDTEYEVAARAMSSGNIYWRVRTYNTDDVASEWSEPATFICISAPATPALSMTQFPQTTATWQSQDQQGWQLQIISDRNVIYDTGSMFGSTNTFRIPKILDDGSYVAQIRVQNQYSLWSDWGTAPLNILNTNLGTISCAYTSGNVANMSWDSSTAFDSYIVYRDGVPIIKTDENTFTDNFTIGQHEYRIIGLVNGSNYYGNSDYFSVTVLPDGAIITDVDNISWLDISLSASSLRNITTNVSYITNAVHLASAVYPSLEMTKYKNKALNIEASFNDEDADALEELFGKIVCVKTHNGDMCIGALNSISCEKNEFIKSYSFTVEQIDWKEEIEI